MGLQIVFHLFADWMAQIDFCDRLSEDSPSNLRLDLVYSASTARKDEQSKELTPTLKKAGLDISEHPRSLRIVFITSGSFSLTAFQCASLVV